jgi:hypothetical protein
MSIVDDLRIPKDHLPTFRELLDWWVNGNRKDVAAAVAEHANELAWVMMFGAYFTHRFGWAEYAILIRLVSLARWETPSAVDRPEQS